MTFWDSFQSNATPNSWLLLPIDKDNDILHQKTKYERKTTSNWEKEKKTTKIIVNRDTFVIKPDYLIGSSLKKKKKQYLINHLLVIFKTIASIIKSNAQYIEEFQGWHEHKTMENLACYSLSGYLSLKPLGGKYVIKKSYHSSVFLLSKSS